MPQTKTRRKEYYQENKDKIIAAVSEYHVANREAICARKREYVAANKELVAERNKKYRKEHKDELAAKAVERSAKTKAFVEAIKAAPCHDCGGSFPPCVMEIHHLTPRRASGASKNWLRWSQEHIERELEKCVVVCANCHCIRDAALNGAE